MSTSLLFPAKAPVTLPAEGGQRFAVGRIFCVGRNYEAHAAEMGGEVDREEPFWFLKGAYAAIPSGSAIPYPPGTGNYHHEIELALVLGKGGFMIDAAEALDLVHGYAAGLDMTRRDLQSVARAKGRPWDFAKDFENSAVFGPFVPAARIGHPTAGRIALSVNGAIRQDADLGELVWKIPELIAYLSRFYHLEPGDIIMTGTPAGFGAVVAGDHIAGEIAGVGTVELTLTAAEA